jgi:ABC-type transport system involved in multi-copper enzyme maturation permease subunit
MNDVSESRPLGSGALLFPEIIGCLVILLVSPFWEIQLLGRGLIFASVVLPAGVTIGSYFLYTGSRKRNWWVAYAAMVAIFLTAFIAYKVGGAPTLR